MFSAKFLRVDVFLFLCSVGIFLVWPEIDYAVSAIAFDPQTGFVFSELLFVKFLYELFAVIQWPVLLVLLYLIWGAWRKRNLSLRTKSVFLLVCLFLGPGLLVNEIIKKTSGRERPKDTVMFFGEREATNFLDFSGTCSSNCSFVSGHAAMGFWFISLFWVYRKSWVFLVGVLIGTAVGVGRILQGSHYLSDVIFAFWAVYLICVLSWHFLMRRSDPEPNR